MENGREVRSEKGKRKGSKYWEWEKKRNVRRRKDKDERLSCRSTEQNEEIKHDVRGETTSVS